MKKILISMLLVLTLVMTSVSAFAIYDIPEAYDMPISDGSITLTVYMAMEAGSEKAMLDYTEHPAIKKWEEATGINFTFIHPPANDDGTFFNTTIASGTLPDIWITGNFNSYYVGNVEGAIDDGILLNLNEYIEKYGHYYLQNAHANWDAKAEKNFMTDSGMYRFGAAEQRVPVLGMQHSGMVVRSDVMEELGLEMPKTIDELHDLLVAFKDYGFEVPLVLEKLDQWWYSGSAFLTSYLDTNTNGFILDENGKVVYSLLQPGYKQYLATLNQWYNEGLIDIDLVSREHSDAKSMLTSGRAAMCDIGNWETQECIAVGKAACGENFYLKGMSCLAKDAESEVYNPYGDPIENGSSTMYWGISTTCKYPEEAFKALDWLYSREGSTLMCFGPQTSIDMLHKDSGEEVTIYTEDENGQRAFTDYILKNDELEYNSIRYIYTIQNLSSEYASEMEYMQYGDECNAQCWDAWTNGTTNDRHIPSSISLTAEESSLQVSTMNNITAYAFEHIYNIVFGEESIDSWDAVCEQIKTMGIDDVIAVQQAAYDRYQAR